MTISGVRSVAAGMIAAALFLTGAAAAERVGAGHSGDYISLLFIGSVASIGDTTANTGTVEIRNDSDTVGGLGLAVGYNWAKKGVPFRTEIEYHYRIRFDHDWRVHGGGYENQLETHALFLNAYADWQLRPTWALFAGGGIGWVGNLSSVTRDSLGIGTGDTSRDDLASNLGWNVALGTIWSMSRNWDAEFRYRYVDLGDVETGPYIDGTRITAGPYTSHDFILGVSYRF